MLFNVHKLALKRFWICRRHSNDTNLMRFRPCQVTELHIVYLSIERHQSSLVIKWLIVHVVEVISFRAALLDCIRKLSQEAINLLLRLILAIQGYTSVSNRLSHVVEFVVKWYPANYV